MNVDTSPEFVSLRLSGCGPQVSRIPLCIAGFSAVKWDRHLSPEDPLQYEGARRQVLGEKENDLRNGPLLIDLFIFVSCHEFLKL